MEAEIGADATLDYVTFQTLQENWYNAVIYSNENEEMARHGLLDQLLDHLPNMKDQFANELCDNLKLELPDDVDQRAWFTKATLLRFLHVIASPDLNKCVAVSNEISQLEETRKFNLSLYSKAEYGIASTDNSKNELLRAVDSRICALMEELVSNFNSAVGGTFSSQEMMDLQEFCQYFADEDIRKLISKLSNASKKAEVADEISESSNSAEAVKHNASLTKAAELERQSSTESEDSSLSENDHPSVERSRTVIRSASPRRSASPMRRIQVGRLGPRRTPALTIKSLTCIPAQERVQSHREIGNDCKSEASGEPDKKTEVNVTRISVQDAISLFESKQREQKVNTQNRSDNSTNAIKSVLRRWSSGVGESQKSTTESLLEQRDSGDYNSELVDEEVKLEKGSTSESLVSEIVKVDMESEMSEQTANLNMNHVPASEAELSSEKLDPAEWNSQREEELNQLLLKFAEENQTNVQNGEHGSDKNCDSGLEQTEAYGQDKEKKGEKIRAGNAGKRVGKQTELRSKKKVPERPKGARTFVKANDAGKEQTTSRTQNVKKKEPAALSTKKESPKPSASKKTSLKKSNPVPATRKSWPSTPLPRGTGILPGKTPVGPNSSGTKAPPQKSQSPAPHQKPKSPGPLSRPSSRAERSNMQQKDVKKPQLDTMKASKMVEDGKSREVPKSGKLTKTKTAMAANGENRRGKVMKTRNIAHQEDRGTSLVKEVGSKKVAKKSSIVPLEAKRSPGKLSDTVHVMERDPAVQKAEIPSQVEEVLSKSEDPSNIQENAVATVSGTVLSAEEIAALEIHGDHVELEKEIDLEKRSDTKKPDSCGEKEISNEIPTEGDEIAEPVISPAAREESEHQDPPSVPAISSPIPSPGHHETVASSEPRIRHSLSQMLLEESSEPDVIEWGNAENPPTMVYQKDAPKGFKRLLKFARKSKREANGASWASPYTSEGEDDGDECKAIGKRSSDNLLRKVTLHSKNHAEGILSGAEPISGRSHVSNSSARGSNKFQEGHGTTKGARSFFSLSAFRGNKS